MKYKKIDISGVEINLGYGYILRQDFLDLCVDIVNSEIKIPPMPKDAKNYLFSAGPRFRVSLVSQISESGPEIIWEYNISNNGEHRVGNILMASTECAELDEGWWGIRENDDSKYSVDNHDGIWDTAMDAFEATWQDGWEPDWVDAEIDRIEKSIHDQAMAIIFSAERGIHVKSNRHAA